jgi:TPR repeat protein
MAIFFAHFPMPALGQEQAEPTLKAEGLPQLLARIDGDAMLQDELKACPGELFGTKENWLSSLLGGNHATDKDDRLACQRDPQACLNACLEGASSEQCFALARAFQENKALASAKHAHMMFAAACARGSAGGCTNRGAGIRNEGFASDPWAFAAPGDRDACLFRTFSASCGAEDAWGCAMLGHSYMTGEGVAADKGQAKARFEKSCAIAPDFEACNFARFLQEMMQ